MGGVINWPTHIILLPSALKTFYYWFIYLRDHIGFSLELSTITIYSATRKFSVVLNFCQASRKAHKFDFNVKKLEAELYKIPQKGGR